MQSICTVCMQHSSRRGFVFLHKLQCVCMCVCLCVSLKQSVIQTHADTLLLKLNCCLAGKQTTSILAISVFFFEHANHSNHRLCLISFRIQHTAGCQICCLHLFLHLNPWLSGLPFSFTQNESLFSPLLLSFFNLCSSV